MFRKEQCFQSENLACFRSLFVPTLRRVSSLFIPPKDKNMVDRARARHHSSERKLLKFAVQEADPKDLIREDLKESEFDSQSVGSMFSKDPPAKLREPEIDELSDESEVKWSLMEAQRQTKALQAL